jgi:holin-like protein
VQYLRQLVIILFISLLGETCNAILPLPIPASVYGMAIMLVLLITGVIRLHQIQKVANLFLEFMPLMFIPIALKILPVWTEFQNVILPFFIISVTGTFLVIVITGRVTQFYVWVFH